MPNTQGPITNQDTGIVYLTKSNAFGEYRSDNLQPGTYMVKIEALGFRDTISVGNIVTVDNNNRVDVSMLVGILYPPASQSSTNRVISAGFSRCRKWPQSDTTSNR